MDPEKIAPFQNSQERGTQRCCLSLSSGVQIVFESRAVAVKTTEAIAYTQANVTTLVGR